MSKHNFEKNVHTSTSCMWELSNNIDNIWTFVELIFQKMIAEPQIGIEPVTL